MVAAGTSPARNAGSLELIVSEPVRARPSAVPPAAGPSSAITIRSAFGRPEGRVRTLAFVINSCPVTSAPSAGADGVRMSTFPRRNTHAHLGNSPPGVFGAVGTGESLAATGRIREQFLGGRAGPAGRYVSAYVLSHRV
jgi:hypothetical protein